MSTESKKLDRKVRALKRIVKEYLYYQQEQLQLDQNHHAEPNKYHGLLL